MQKKKSEVSNQKILQAILDLDKKNSNSIDELAKSVNNFANHTEKRFNTMDQRFDTMESHITNIKSTMVTKDYLDDKLSDFKIDMMATVYKNDNKVNTLVNVLGNKKVITKKESKLIMST